MPDFALQFDGSQSSVLFGIASVPTTTTPITIAAWVSNQLDAVNSPSSQNFLAYKYWRMYFRLGTAAGISVGRIRFDETVAHEANGQTAELSSNNQSPHFYLGSYEPTGGVNSTLRFYVDGVKKQTLNNTALPTTDYTGSTAQIGRTGANYFKGAIDKVRIYHAVPTDGEVTALYNSGTDFTTPQVSYDFNEGSGTTTADASGNAQTGTLTGSPAPKWTTGLNAYGNVAGNFYGI